VFRKRRQDGKTEWQRIGNQIDAAMIFSGARPQRELALLRYRCHGRRSRPERTTCWQWTRANLRDANTAARRWRLPRIFRASARSGKWGKGCEARRVGYGAAV